jgi:hypothetical protein
VECSVLSFSAKRPGHALIYSEKHGELLRYQYLFENGVFVQMGICHQSVGKQYHVKFRHTGFLQEVYIHMVYQAYTI